MPKNPQCQQVVSCFNVTGSDAVFIAGEGGKKHNSQFYFCEKIHFAKRPTTFHQRARLLLMAKVTISKYLPARFFNQMMPLRIFFTLKTPRGSGEL